jgi:ABC-type phosphate transport system substrate-binding protein
MNQPNTLVKLMISGAVVAAIGLSASAQTTTTPKASAPSAGNLTSAGKSKPTSATAQMIQEACQRSKARRAKFLQNGTPEQFGSEEPFTFDPNAPPC